MKNLWTILPPPLGDSFGLIELIKNSDGCAVLDDSGEFRLGGGGGHGSRHGGGGGKGGHVGFDRHGDHGSDNRGSKGGGRSSRTVVSGAGSQDVTTGTHDILLRAAENALARFSPDFMLFAAGPCGAMIGTNLSDIAEVVSAEHQIPAAAVELTGQKTYDVGVSKTTEAMARLLAGSGEMQAGAINILGATALDWAQSDMEDAASWAEQQGWHVLSRPGGTVTKAQLERMGQAQFNLVVTVSGLAAARYLQSRFGTPYIALSPFGDAQCGKLVQAVDNASWSETYARPEADVLVIGEQFTANAIRAALEEKGMAKSADAATFFQLDKVHARSNDLRIKGEAHAREQLNCGKYHTIIADPVLRPLLQCRRRWIDLPHSALNPYSTKHSVPLFGSKLDNWLEQYI